LVADGVDEIGDAGRSEDLRRIAAEEPQTAFDRRPAKCRSRGEVGGFILILWERIHIIGVGQDSWLGAAVRNKTLQGESGVWLQGAELETRAEFPVKTIRTRFCNNGDDAARRAH